MSLTGTIQAEPVAEPRRPSRTWLRARPARYGLAVSLVGAALLVTIALEQLVTNAISPLFFLAIMLSACQAESTTLRRSCVRAAARGRARSLRTWGRPSR